MMKIPHKFMGLLGKFADSLDYKDLPKGWADNPDIVQAAEELYRDMGTESPFFKAWFGKGSLVDDAGRPKVVYHGTPASSVDNWAFDPGMVGRHATSEGRGFYTAANKDVAQGYSGDGGNILSLYSNIAKPLELEGQKPFTVSQLKKIIKDSATAEAKNMAKDDGVKYTPSMLRDSWISNYTYTYDKPVNDTIREVAEKIHENNDNPFDQLGEIAYSSGDWSNAFRSAKKNTGYDSVHSYGYKGTSGDDASATGDIYVNWFPEQLKSTSNRGTFNPSDPNIYKALPWAVGGAAAAAALAPSSAQASIPADEYPWPAKNPGYVNREPGLEAPVVDPVDIMTAPIGAATAGGKVAAMAAEPFLAYGMDKAGNWLGNRLGGLLGYFGWGD